MGCEGVNKMKYYVIRTTRNGVEYKRYKCIDGWKKEPIGCWQFTKQGAERIAKRLNEQVCFDSQPYPKRVHFSIKRVCE